MKKFKIGLVLMLSFLLVVLSACGNSEKSTAGKADSQKKPLQFFVSGDNVEGGALKTMAAEYTKETGVKIEVVDVPFSDFATRITNMIQAGNPPALARTAQFNPVWRDHLDDLSSTLKSKNIDENLAIKDNGKIKAVPIDLTAVGLFINKDLFDKAGVKYPTSEKDVWTWDEFVNDLKTVLAKTDAKYGLVMDPSEHRLTTMLYQFGSKGFYEENGKYTTNDATKKALEYFVKLNDNKIMPTAIWGAGGDPSAMFKSGQVAAYLSGVWQLKDFDKNIKNFKWASVYMPYEKVRSTNLGGNYIVKFKGSGVEKETQAFIDWLYTKKNYEKLAGLGGYLPVVKDAKVDYHASETATNSYQVYRNEMKSSDPIAAKLRATRDKLQLVSEKAANNVVKDNVVKVLNKEETIDQAIKDSEQKYTDAFVSKK